MLVQDQQEARLEVVIGPDSVEPESLAVEAFRSDSQPMASASGVSKPRSFWRLVPREGGGEAAAVLASPTLFSIERAELQMRREATGGAVQRSDAELRLIGEPCLSVIAASLDGASLPVDTLHAVQQVVVGDAFMASCRREPLPAMLTECTERLARLDLSPLGKVQGQIRPTRLVGYAWVDESLAPVGSAQACELLGADFAMAGLTLRERLERLSHLRLLAILGVGASGEERLTVLLRPDAVWLWGGMESTGGGHVVHDSHWLAELHANPLAISQDAAVAQVLGTMTLKFFDYRYVVENENLFVKILLTPLALAGDVCLLGVCAYLISLGDDDDDRQSCHRH
jgi:hypothetical protein